MKFGHPILTSELSGSLGGVVASSSRGGLGYFRVRSTPGNPKSPAQTRMRFILSSIAAAWRSTLTGAQRLAWGSIAGENSSGIDAFTQSQSINLLGGGALVTDAPDSLALAADPITVTPVVDASAHTITVTIPAADDETKTCVFLSKPQSASRLARQFNYTFAGVVDFEGTGAQVVAIPTSHPAYNLTAGDIVYVRTVIYSPSDAVNPGGVASAQEFRITVAA